MVIHKIKQDPNSKFLHTFTEKRKMQNPIKSSTYKKKIISCWFIYNIKSFYVVGTHYTHIQNPQSTTYQILNSVYSPVEKCQPLCLWQRRLIRIIIIIKKKLLESFMNGLLLGFWDPYIPQFIRT